MNEELTKLEIKIIRDLKELHKDYFLSLSKETDKLKELKAWVKSSNIGMNAVTTDILLSKIDELLNS